MSKGLIEVALGSDVTQQSKAKGSRLLKVGSRASRDYVELLDRKLDNLNSEMEELMEISAGTDINQGVQAITDDEMKKRVEKYHKLSLEAALTLKEKEVAEKVHEKLVGDNT